MCESTIEIEFSETFTQYGDAIFRFCLVKVSSKELAEDMTQEVFMRYWQYLKAKKDITNTRALLYTIANNLAKDWYKRKKSDSLDDRLALGLEPTEKSAGPEMLFAHQEVIAAMEGMDTMDRDVLVLRYVEGLDPKDIADILEETANVISVRLHRATKRLQQLLHI